MELKKLMIESKAVWVEFPGIEDFEIEVVSLSRPELNKLRKACITSRWDRKVRGLVESLNEKLFVKEFTNKIISDWRGLTFAGLASLVLIDERKIEDLEAEVEYTTKNAEFLVENSIEFDTWINEVIFDLDNFRSSTERESI